MIAKDNVFIVAKFDGTFPEEGILCRCFRRKMVQIGNLIRQLDWLAIDVNGLVAQFETADLFRSRIDAFGPFDKILLDPPREGALEILKTLGAGWPARIVYVACDPATLARDAAVLVHTKGFALEAAGVVNMFPHTAHVESIAVFELPA